LNLKQNTCYIQLQLLATEGLRSSFFASERHWGASVPKPLSEPPPQFERKCQVPGCMSVDKWLYEHDTTQSHHRLVLWPQAYRHRHGWHTCIYTR